MVIYPLQKTAESEPTVAQLSNYDVFSYLNYAIEDSWDEKNLEEQSNRSKVIVARSISKKCSFSV